MEAPHYLAALQADATRLAEVARKGLDAPVPPCPGWTVSDVVEHVAVVYLHKVETMRRQAPPRPWPPDVSGREPLELLAEAHAALVAELRARGPEAPSPTWYAPDQTVGFWYRRMAQETAVHRCDVESAHGPMTPVDPELAADGVDEVLVCMLAGGVGEVPDDEVGGRSLDLAVRGPHAATWRVRCGRDEVTVVRHDTDPGIADVADAVVTGDPEDVLLWCWGRGPLDRLEVEGDPVVVAALRRRLALATR